MPYFMLRQGMWLLSVALPQGDHWVTFLKTFDYSTSLLNGIDEISVLVIPTCRRAAGEIELSCQRTARLNLESGRGLTPPRLDWWRLTIGLSFHFWPPNCPTTLSDLAPSWCRPPTLRPPTRAARHLRLLSAPERAPENAKGCRNPSPFLARQATSTFKGQR
jgi:hypothetical protein